MLPRLEALPPPRRPARLPSIERSRPPIALANWSAPLREEASLPKTSSRAGTAAWVAEEVCCCEPPTRPPSLLSTSPEIWLEIKSTIFMMVVLERDGIDLRERNRILPWVRRPPSLTSHRFPGEGGR